MSETPEHREGFATRSGDNHVIGDDGEAVNTCQAARDVAAAETAKAAKRAPAAGGREPGKPATDSAAAD